MRSVILLVCVVLASVARGEPAAEVDSLLSRMHEATKAADADTYFNLFTEDAVFFGTDIWERWPLDEFEAKYRPYMESGRGWWFQMRDRHVSIQPGGTVALFDETLFSDAYGQCRGTGACRLQDGQWKIASYHLDITLPNGIADELVAQIHQFEADRVELMTFNIRFAAADDGANAWPNRRDLVAALIRKEAPDVLGLQEALRIQVDELAERLPGYAWVGVGRNDGHDKGEFAPIFYNDDTLALIDSGTFWLSDTPEVPGSTSFGNTIPRICTWAEFETKPAEVNRRFVVINLHLDHLSSDSRLQSLRLVRRRLDDGTIPGGPDRFVIGDFNCPPNSEPVALLLDDGFAAALGTDPNISGTFHGFTGKATKRIDMILVPTASEVEEAEIIRDGGPDGLWPSDHFPVRAVVTLNGAR